MLHDVLQKKKQQQKNTESSNTDERSRDPN